MLGKRIINAGGGVACTTDTTQILDGGSTQSTALYRFEDNANDTASGTGKFGKGARFTSALTTRIDVSSNAAFAKSNDFSLSMWFYIDTMASGDNQTILAYNTSAAPRYFIMFNNGNIGNIRFYGGGSTNRYSANNLFSTGSWYHLAVSKSSTAGLVVYLNGTAVITETGETAAYTNGSQANSKNCIGAYYAANSHLYPFKGKIDQFRVFNKPITQAEVNTLYTETSSTVNTLQILGDYSCVATYTFEGNADDLSNNYDATATSDVIYDYSGTASNVTYATGKFNKSAVFNGSSSLVTVSSPLPWANSFSISMWLKPSSGLSASNYYIPFYQKGYDSSIGGTGVAFYTYGYVLRPWVGSIGGSYYNIFNTGTLTANQWNHVVLTRSYGVAWELFLNGSSLGTYTAQGLTNDFSDTEYYFGGFFGASYRYNGEIDQVRIFDKALSSGEINSLYNETTTTAALGTITNPSTIAYYKMADATDETGAYNGTATDVNFNIEGKYGFAGKFNGSSSRINTGLTWPGGTEISWSFWINTAGGVNQYLFGDFNDSGSNNSSRLSAQFHNSNVLYILTNNGSTGTTTNAGSIASYLNKWTHVAITVNGTEVKAYLDGSLFNTHTGTAITAGANPFVIGAYTNNSSRQNVNGKIDQVRIFNKAISASEVTKLYNEVQCANTITTPGSYFNTKLYSGNGSTQSITGIGFKPNLLWWKARNSSSYNWKAVDSINGPTYNLYQNLTNALATDVATTSFDSDGFTFGSGGNGNTSSLNYASYAWKGAASSATNNDGIIASTVSASPESGFSIVKWTASSTASDTIGSGLGKKVDFLITKKLNGSRDWHVWHKDLPNNGYLSLNGTAAESTPNGNRATVTNNNTFIAESTSGDSMIAYCFANIDGYQRIDHYIGNGSATGPSVYTGFEPAFVIIKRTDVADNWLIFDQPRNTALFPNSSGVELSGYDGLLKFRTNGFSINTTDNSMNNSGGRYIFMAIAANPDTTAPTKANSFNTVTYSNPSTSQAYAAGFKPDFVWFKERNGTNSHQLYDTIRSDHEALYSNTTDGEYDYSSHPSGDLAPTITSTGFTTPAVVNNGINNSSSSYVAWAWKAADHDRNLATINNDGNITSVVSANPEAGFSIITYSPNNTVGMSIGHGLSQAPSFVITKRLDTSQDWGVYTNVSTGNTTTNWLSLNDSDAYGSGSFMTLNPTTLELPQTGAFWSSASSNQVAYCWHSVTGYSSIGKYTGTGVSGLEIALDFSPSFLLVKGTGATGWIIIDNQRPTPGGNYELYPNFNSAEDTSATSFLLGTNKFTVNSTGTWHNTNGTDYIYLAIK